MERNIELMQLAYKIIEDSFYLHDGLPTEDQLTKKVLEIYDALFKKCEESSIEYEKILRAIESLRSVVMTLPGVSDPENY